MTGSVNNAGCAWVYAAPSLLIENKSFMKHDEASQGFGLLGGSSYYLSQLGPVGKWMVLTGEILDA